eukprot:Clim_evm4s109 gene=Clim_evmTU4s109
MAGGIHSSVSLAGFIGLNLLGGAAGGWVTKQNVGESFYAKIEKPSWAPPNWLFGPVWSTIYVSIGIAAWRIFESDLPAHTISDLMAKYWTNMLINFSFSFIYFGAHQQLLGALTVLATAVTAAGVGRSFHAVDPFAGYLYIPYVLWGTYATVLSFTTYVMNRNKKL